MKELEGGVVDSDESNRAARSSTRIDDELLSAIAVGVGPKTREHAVW